uniref:Candidate secreted effector n=1 Tax=Meloidogyne incognita TaxID=6306 RepID=A0A914LR83_MELIC
MSNSSFNLILSNNTTTSPSIISTSPAVRAYWINTTKPFQLIYVFIVMIPLIIAQLIILILLSKLIFLVKW